MEFTVKKLREAREFLIDKRMSGTNELTLFIGLYNGSDYLETISKQINEQSFAEVNLLIVDNCSTDDTWSKIGKIDTEKFANVTILKNPINNGAHGSMSLNIDQIRTPWITFMHQDDIYRLDHLMQLSTAIRSAKPEEIIFSTDMGAISSDGNLIGSPPRSVWFQKNNDPITAFLTNLRTHSIPDSCSVYRLDIFKKVLPAWHNTTFPDTEMILRMCAYGRFVQLNVETVMYREHENSISHLVNSSERDLGISISLLNVINSEEFNIICSQIQKTDRDNFMNSMMKGVEFRIKNEQFLLLVKTHLSEVMWRNWGYFSESSLQHLRENYEKVNSTFSVELFSRLQHHLNGIQGKQKSHNPRIYNLNSPITNSAHRVKNYGAKGVYLNYGYLLPYRIRRALLKIFVRVRILVKGRDPWGML